MAEEEDVTGPVEAPAVTQSGSTFAERKKAREAAERKALGGSDAENKEVSSGESKGRRRK